MSLRRGLATLLLLPLFVILARGAWYGHYSVTFLYRIADPSEGGLGIDAGEAVQLFTMVRWGVPVVAILGGLLGLAVGPWGLLVVGAAFSALGYALMGIPIPWLDHLAVALVMAGHGLSIPGVMAAAAVAFRARAEHLRTAAVALAYLGLNVGALLGPLTSEAVHTHGSFRLAFLASSGASILALLLAALLGGAVFLTRKEEAAFSEPTPPTARLLLGALGLAVVLAVPWTCSLQLFELAASVLTDNPLPEPLTSSWVGVNPAVCVASAVLLAGLAGVMHLARWRLPALFPMALGMLLLALGQALVLVLGRTVSPWAVVAGLAIAALGEALLMAFYFSRLLGDFGWRTVALVAAVFGAAHTFLGLLIAWIGDALAVDGWSGWVGWTGVVTGLLAAIVLAVAAIPAERWCWRVER